MTFVHVYTTEHVAQGTERLRPSLEPSWSSFVLRLSLFGLGRVQRGRRVVGTAWNPTDHESLSRQELCRVGPLYVISGCRSAAARRPGRVFSVEVIRPAKQTETDVSTEQ